jgi:predicted transcriptional regulator
MEIGGELGGSSRRAVQLCRVVGSWRRVVVVVVVVVVVYEMASLEIESEQSYSQSEEE